MSFVAKQAACTATPAAHSHTYHRLPPVERRHAVKQPCHIWAATVALTSRRR